MVKASFSTSSDASMSLLRAIWYFISSKQDYIILISKEWISLASLDDLIDFSITYILSEDYLSSKDLTTWSRIHGNKSNLLTRNAVIVFSRCLIPPSYRLCGLSEIHFTNAWGFYFLISWARKASLQFCLTLWTLQTIIPLMICGLNFIDNKSRTSYL